MENDVTLDAIYRPSDDIVAREIEGELIIVPLTSGVGDVENALYTLNPTGDAIWSKLDGKRSLRKIAKELEEEFEAPPGEIEKDILGLVQELVNRNIIAEA